MEALQRHIADGRQYEGLFPAPSGGTELLKRGARLEDTLRALPKVARAYAWQAKGIAGVLKGANLRETCRKTWEFCYRNIQYKPDEKGKEQVRSPARSWHDRKTGIDCDCFTVLVSAILLNLGIPHRMRVAKYPLPGDPDPPYQHIYVVVPVAGGHITIDPVTNAFDHEVPYLQKKDIDMDLEILNGTPTSLGRTGIDQAELFNGLGATATTTAGNDKFSRMEAEAKAKGMTIAQYQQWSREEFIRKNGMTPEQWAAKLQADIAKGHTASTAKTSTEIEAMKAELRKRGVPVPANATHAQLLEMLRSNPAPKPAANVLHDINKVNPATVLLRTGLVLAMKTNLLGVAKKIRWALATPEEARKAGMSAADHTQLVEAWERVKKLHHGAGGDVAHLMDALAEGKGNKDEAVKLNGLGEPVTATAAIGAATAAMTAIAVMVKAIKVPETPPAATTGQGLQPAKPSTTSTPVPDNEPQSQMDNAPEGAPKKGPWEWVKANPLPSAGIGVAALGLGYLAVKALAGKAKGGEALSGTPVTVKKGKGKGKSKGRQPERVRIP